MSCCGRRRHECRHLRGDLWEDATAWFFFLLVLLFQVLLRSQWAVKYTCRRRSTERWLQGGTSLDRRAEELLVKRPAIRHEPISFYFD